MMKTEKKYIGKCPYCNKVNKVTVSGELIKKAKKLNKNLSPRYCTECGNKISYSLSK